MIAKLLASAAFAAPTHAAAESAVWRDTGSQDHEALAGIQLARAMVGGTECFRGRAATDVDPEALLQVVTDIPSHPRWSSVRLLDSRLLSASPSSISYVQVVDVPSWTLASDRFWFLQGAVERTAGRRALRWSRLPENAWQEVRAEITAAHPGAIEVPVNLGAWIFDASPTGTAITYYVCSEAGGSLPLSFQHSATTRSLPETMGSMVAESRRR